MPSFEELAFKLAKDPGWGWVIARYSTVVGPIAAAAAVLILV